MKKIALILGLVASALTVHANTIAFDTFGPANTYNSSTGFATGFNVTEAVQFTSLGSGNLLTVDLGLTANAPGPANVFLYGDASGAINTASSTFLGSVTPTALFGSTNSTVVSLSVGGSVPLTLGTTYWLALFPTNSSMQVIWNQSITTVGNRDFSNDGGSTWQTTPTGNLTAAFRLTVSDITSSSVPDSGSTIALMLAAVTPLIAFRSKLQARG
jgi:hypothetical protein